jgi:hypothetical protein
MNALILIALVGTLGCLLAGVIIWRMQRLTYTAAPDPQASEIENRLRQVTHQASVSQDTRYVPARSNTRPLNKRMVRKLSR